jgi:cytochrome c oxidase subunit 1
MFFPFVGMVAEAASVFSDRRFFGYKLFIPALLGFTALSMTAWAHHMFTTGAIPVELFALTSTALIVPAGVEYFDIIATMWRGSIRLTTSMLFVVGFLVQFLIGGLSGIFVASPTLDFHAHDSYIIVAHFHYTLLAGSVFALFAGVYLWWPKITGRRLNERLGKTHFWLMAIGTNLTFIPQFILGYDGMARRLPDYASGTGWQGLNVASTVGSFLIAVSILVFVLAVAGSFLRRPLEAPDPWGTGCSLEWAAPSPPPRWNFVGPLPPVRSYAPLWDARHPEEAEGEAPPVAPPAPVGVGVRA